MYKNTKIGVLMGGPSPEHEVSLASGEEVLKALAARGREPAVLLLTKDRKLFAGKDELAFPEGFKEFGVIFNALHGVFGEDGQIQRILDSLGVAYTGSGAEASELGMDKWASRSRFQEHGLRVPRGMLIRQPLDSVLPPPVVLKPRASGSSDGVFIAKSQDELQDKIVHLLARGDEVLAEEYVQGREFTCGILEIDGRPLALPVVEIRPAAKYEFFDYEAKYTPGASDEIVPAPIEPELAAEIQRIALAAHDVLGCRIYSRSDFIVRDGEIYLLETNTLPGLTRNSLLPKAARAYGLEFPDLVEIILRSSEVEKK